MKRALIWLWVAVALLWHAATLWDAYQRILRESHGRDYASYHYAAVVAFSGGDPYDKQALGQAARAEGTRAGVHPFFYPPPFLLVVAFSPLMKLVTAWRLWFWLDAAASLAVALALARWWRGLSAWVLPLSVGVLAGLTAIPNNHSMGQANLPVLLLVVLGLWAAERERPVVGGALVGMACMMKMSPALFVAWWLLRGRWRPAAAACGMAVVLSVATLPVLGLAEQWRFYTEVLPGFASGDYNGLGVPMTLFGNHSLPNLWIQAFPARGNQLSDTAALLSRLSMLALVLGQAAMWRRAPEDSLQRAAQIGAVGCTMLLVPVYTYEHHLIWAWPAVVVLGVAAVQRRLPLWWLPVLGVAVVVWCWELSELKRWSLSLTRGGNSTLGWLVQEAKFFSLLVLWGTSAWLGARRG